MRISSSHSGRLSSLQSLTHPLTPVPAPHQLQSPGGVRAPRCVASCRRSRPPPITATELGRSTQPWSVMTPTRKSIIQSHKRLKAAYKGQVILSVFKLVKCETRYCFFNYLAGAGWCQGPHPEHEGC